MNHTNTHIYKTVFLFFFLFISSVSFVKAQEQGIIINEFSNGPSGTKEYIEFLVVGCSGSRVDIRGWKFDDNNGDFSGGPITGKGIAPGHSRFSMDAQWSSVPVGSLILVYNAGDKNGSITLPDDPSDADVDSVYILSHNYSTLIQTCDGLPNTGVGNDNYIGCTIFGVGLWTTVGMRNDGDATQVRRPDGTYFHGFGWGDNNGGVDNLHFNGSGTAKAYSYTSSSCNYRDITNFSAQSAPAGETPGRPNNASNLNYIKFLREGITSGVISNNQTICSGVTPAGLIESGAVIRCYVNYQWQSSSSGLAGSYANIGGATSVTYNPPALTATTYYRRVVSNICQHDTSNIVIITVTSPITRADKPSAAVTDLCLNPPNSSVTTNPVAGAAGYSWELFPAGAGTISGVTTSATIDWGNTYSGIAKVVVKSLGCGGNVASDTLSFTISNAQANAGTDQLNNCTTSVTLSANAGAGNWSIVSGTGGNFFNQTFYNSTFSGTPGETYNLRWSVPASACMTAGTDDVQISFATVPSAPQTNDIDTCVSGSFLLTASGGSNGEYRWYQSASPTPIAGGVNDTYQTPFLSVSTSYYVSLHNGSCESPKVPLNVTIGGMGQVDAGNDVNIVKGESVTLNGSGNGSFHWSPPTSLNNPSLPNPIARPEETTTYVLTVVSPEGCHYTDSVTVSVLCDQIYIPNLITPNGDNKNDSFVIGGCINALNWKLEISNRWGDIVYHNSNYNNEWHAEGLSDGVYYFYLTSEVLNVTYKGWIEVLN